MKKRYNILVTGCGGDIGQSICKILTGSAICNQIYGCDIHENHPGKFLCDEFQIVPKCSDADYFRVLQELTESKSIDIIIPTSEPELRFFLKKGISKSLFNRPVIMANEIALEIGFDKLKTADFLKNAGLPYPKTEILGETKYNSFPAIIKNRKGAGSKQVIIINDTFDFNYYKIKYPQFIIQEYLAADDAEYTCGLFRSKSGECRDIVFKRTLSGGYSGYGVVEINEEISDLLKKIALHLDLVGSINVQLRQVPQGPIVFEINPRFSSTVLFRHLFGFKDLIWAIEDELGFGISECSPIKNGLKFYKGYEEYYE